MESNIYLSVFVLIMNIYNIVINIFRKLVLLAPLNVCC